MVSTKLKSSSIKKYLKKNIKILRSSEKAKNSVFCGWLLLLPEQKLSIYTLLLKVSCDEFSINSEKTQFGF